MDLYFLDDNFSIIDGPIDTFTSIVWCERYFEIGTFTLHFPREVLNRVMNATYVSTSPAEGEIKCGRIDYIIADDDVDCEMGGRLLESLLSDRVIRGKGVFTGDVASITEFVVTDNLRDCGITMGTSDSVSGYASLAYEYNCISDWLYSVLKPFGASFSVKLDPESREPVFRVINGKNRTVDGPREEGIQPAIFSSSFGNISSIRLESDSSRMKNYIFVEGKDGTVVTVDKSDGGQIREMYYHAGDIAAGSFATAELYKEALVCRGESVLRKFNAGLSLSAECDGDALPRYGVDYFLGDICDVADEALGMSFDMRLTGVDTVCENGVKTVFPLFGEEIRYIDRLKSQL